MFFKICLIIICLFVVAVVVVELVSIQCGSHRLIPSLDDTHAYHFGLSDPNRAKSAFIT